MRSFLTDKGISDQDVTLPPISVQPDVARMCAQLGLRLEARGEGRAVRQNPESGAEIDPGQIIRVDFGRPN